MPLPGRQMCCWIDAGNTLPKPKAGPSLLLPPNAAGSVLLRGLRGAELVAVQPAVASVWGSLSCPEPWAMAPL